MKNKSNITIKDFEKSLEYKFKNKNLLYNALTHSSYINESNKDYKLNNERLEFLGDATLELIISEYLYNNYPNLTEGELTKMRAKIVCTDSLAETAFKLNIGSVIIMGKGEVMTGGRKRKSIMANTMEAIIGAIYLDGGLVCAREFIIQKLNEIIKNVEKGRVNKDYKSLLQEYVQKEKNNILQYKLTKEEGPDHDKKFYIDVSINDVIYGTGIGKNKKDTEQQAAKNALDYFKKNKDKDRIN